MIITFLLPGGVRRSSGGVKIIFEYANRLCYDGNYVNIIEPCHWTKKRQFFLKTLKRWLYYKLTKNYIPKWFELHRNVKCLLSWSLAEKYIPVSDITIATYVETAFWCSDYSNTKKYYLIQGFEDWSVSKELVLESYKLPLKKIVVSPWLYNSVKSVNEEADIVTNGFDTNFFKILVDIKERNQFNILMMWHRDELKRCIDVIRAIEKAKERYPAIHVSMFSVYPKPGRVPFDFDYYYKPNKNELVNLYNNNSIYVAASRAEGFGLTVGEAMLCGCAIACTNNEGFSVMAIDHETALVSEIYDVDSLSANIIKLIENNDLRLSLCERALKHMEKFNMDSAYNQFKLCLLKA
jgi:glycosyltransferase involved in cell wall biosynthesis